MSAQAAECYKFPIENQRFAFSRDNLRLTISLEMLSLRFEMFDIATCCWPIGSLRLIRLAFREFKSFFFSFSPRLRLQLAAFLASFHYRLRF
jgi:hypothetical protein